MATRQNYRITPEQEQAVLYWNQCAQALKAAKDAEAAARENVYTLFADTSARGVQAFQFENGYTLKITNKWTYKLTDTGEPLDAVLTAIEALPGGDEIARALVPFKPALSVSVYGQIGANVRALIDPLIDVSRATPSVELTAPKKTAALAQ